MKPLCIYHANCVDGFTAAWVVNEFYSGEVEFFAATYNEPPPIVTGREVMIVDFSYKRPVMEQLVKEAKSVLVLDHHKTAEEELKPWIEIDDPQYSVSPGNIMPEQGCRAVFDMNRSGAGLTWDYLHAKERPWLVDMVEDRDLWKFKLDGTRELHSYLTSIEWTFENWTNTSREIDAGVGQVFFMQGEAIDRKHLMNCKEVIKAGKHYADIAGYTVPVCSAPFFMASDIGNIMAKNELFAATFYDRADGKRVYSLRAKGKVDVSEVAKKFGGGGHANAAGFTVNSFETLG